MAASCVMKQVQDCHMTTEIVKCVWSPKVDLFAIANAQGQVAMHRLTCQRVWQANPPVDNAKVTGLAWRPDNEIIAVGYTSGHVVLMDIENSREVHRICLEEEISTISWVANNATDSNNTSSEDDKDPWSKYMAPLPPLTKTYSGSVTLRGESEDSWQETRLLQDQTSLTLLTVATSSANVYLYVFGLFHCATYEISHVVSGVTKIIDVIPSQDLHMLSIVLERIASDGEKEIAHVTLETLILAWRHKELCALACKYGQIYTLMTYASQVLTQIEEAWESILLEMDNKLADYAKAVPEGGVTADFLDLLVFGYLTPDFDMFLTDKLSDKGLKKLRHSVELSYTNMEKLVVKNLQSVGQTLFFLLSQVVGMSRREDRFQMLGLKEEDITVAVQEAGAFLLKTVEIQQVIAISMRNFNAFLKWLSRVVMKNLGDQGTPELSFTTKEEQSHIISFLHDSLEETVIGSDGQKRTRFCLEKVGQYLKDEALTKPYDMGNNAWVKFLSANKDLANHPLIMPHHVDQSLKQAYNNLKTVLNNMVAHPVSSISEKINIVSTVSIVNLPTSVSAKVTQVSIPTKEVVYTVVIPDNRQSLFYLAQWSTNPDYLTSKSGPGPQRHVYASPFVFSSLDHNSSHILDTSKCFSVPALMLVVDAQFYTENTLSLLLQDVDDNKSSYFVQLWVPGAVDELKPLGLPEGHRVGGTGIPARDASRLHDAASHRKLEVGVASGLAVSGIRKLFVILSENKRRIRLYMMEADEDEDDDEENETQHESIINISGQSDQNEIL